MGLPQLAAGDVGQTARDKVNAGLAAADSNAAAVASLSAAAGSLQQQIAANTAQVQAANAANASAIATLGAAASGLQQQIAANAISTDGRTDALRVLLDSATARLAALAASEAADFAAVAAGLAQEIVDRTAALAAESDARQAADADLLLRVEAAMLSDRPGDARGAFTFTSNLGGLAGPRAALPILPVTMIAVGDAGAEARITGACILGMRRAVAIEPGRLYQPRAVIRRRANPSDPSGDAIRFNIAWLDRAAGLLPFQQATSPVATFRALVTGDGRQERQSLFARAVTPEAALVAPAAARYAVAYVQHYGDGVTGVEVLGIDDVSEGAILDPQTASTVQAVAGLVSQDLPARVERLESKAGTTQEVTFATRTDAQAGAIPDSVNVVELLGLYGIGDGGGALYARAVPPVPAGADSFTHTATGSVWVRVIPSAALAASWIEAGYAYWALNVASRQPVPGKAWYDDAGLIRIAQ